MTITDDALAGFIVGMVLLVFGVPIVARALARADGDPKMFRLVMTAGALKLASVPLWIYVIDHFYGGSADAYTYSGAGMNYASYLRAMDFSFHVSRFVGDGATGLITGIVYAVIGPNVLGAFFVFAFLAFISLALFYRAFRVALPEGDHRRYALLVFFLPSLVFWTSAIGKDALVSLGLGLAALGGARVFARVRGGVPLLAVGLAFAALIRPHLALLLLVSFGIAFPLVRARNPTAFSPVIRVVQVIALIVGGLVLAKVTAHFFGVHSLSSNSLQHVLKKNAANTGTAARGQVGQFNSSGATSTSLSPLAIPKDIYYTVIRPLPFQAHGMSQRLSSLESLFIVGLFAVSWRRLVAAVRAMRSHPYLLAVAFYSLVWIVLFASIGNLGILARERTSLYPLLLMLVCWPSSRAAPAEEPAEQPGAAEPELVGGVRLT